jgi:5-methylcytosine-specific restriction endonuclease McrA
VCGICHRPILDRERISLDHIVPLSRGGTVCRLNTQPAHHSCNSRRGNRPDRAIEQRSPRRRTDPSFRPQAPHQVDQLDDGIRRDPRTHASSVQVVLYGLSRFNGCAA